MVNEELKNMKKYVIGGGAYLFKHFPKNLQRLEVKC